MLLWSLKDPLLLKCFPTSSNVLRDNCEVWKLRCYWNVFQYPPKSFDVIMKFEGSAIIEMSSNILQWPPMLLWSLKAPLLLKCLPISSNVIRCYYEVWRLHYFWNVFQYPPMSSDVIMKFEGLPLIVEGYLCEEMVMYPSRSITYWIAILREKLFCGRNKNKAQQSSWSISPRYVFIDFDRRFWLGSEVRLALSILVYEAIRNLLTLWGLWKLLKKRSRWHEMCQEISTPEDSTIHYDGKKIAPRSVLDLFPRNY